MICTKVATATFNADLICF